VAVILGRAQFFTENMLYPVLVSLEDRSAIPGTLRLWAIVYAANLGSGSAGCSAGLGP
jgi:formate/nitrite transporter FocA (FNT family)